MTLLLMKHLLHSGWLRPTRTFQQLSTVQKGRNQKLYVGRSYIDNTLKTDEENPKPMPLYHTFEIRCTSSSSSSSSRVDEEEEE